MRLLIISIVNVDLERLVNKFVNIVVGLLLAVSACAQSDSLTVVSADTVVEVVAPAPVIEYTMQRKT